MALETSTARPPEVAPDSVSFFLNDPEGEFDRVQLAQEIHRPWVGPDFEFDHPSRRWVLRWPRPDVDRLEYQLVVTTRRGVTQHILDPANPTTAPGPLGPKSVVEFPDYSPPAWRGGSHGAGVVEELDIHSRTLKAKVPGRLWTAAGARADSELPLLVVHDGPEYADYSSLVDFLEHEVACGRLPSMRAALIGPIDRDQTYSASALYGRALAHEILPAILSGAPAPHGRTMRVGMGASLGALAMMHAHRSLPATFGGLFLQSGSFFRQRFDAQERGFVRFRRITRFVGQVLSAPTWAHPIPVAMTCGTAEENLLNNQAMRDALVRQGYEVSWHEHRDAHNWVAWRDALDPHLGDLLRELWS